MSSTTIWEMLQKPTAARQILLNSHRGKIKSLIKSPNYYRIFHLKNKGGGSGPKIKFGGGEHGEEGLRKLNSWGGVSQNFLLTFPLVVVIE